MYFAGAPGVAGKDDDDGGREMLDTNGNRPSFAESLGRRGLLVGVVWFDDE
jgi:hypothetical protein